MSVQSAVLQSAALQSAVLILLFATALPSLGLGEAASQHSNLRGHNVVVDAVVGALLLASLHSNIRGQSYPPWPMSRASFDVYEEEEAVDNATNPRSDIEDALRHGYNDLS
ncbi:hypothetical protein V8D89_012184 [Ganoderma adspersum]